MEWTRALPTIPGYYWCRFGTPERRNVKMVYVNRRLRVEFHKGISMAGVVMGTLHQAEWYGPISVPEGRAGPTDAGGAGAAVARADKPAP